ncbi:zf-RVT domain-containing protein, partial [Cephalotus follicularis]
WQGIHTVSSAVAWHSLVWHPKGIPKHAFCFWLTLRGAHRTRDKLVAMGVTHHTSCLFNCGEPETLDHLFFHCPFSSRVWLEVLALCNLVRPILPSADEVDWMIIHSPGTMFHHSLRKLAMAATIFHLWIERNNRCFSNRFLPHRELVQRVRQDVEGKLAAGNNAQRCDHHHNLCVNWGIPLLDIQEY